MLSHFFQEIARHLRPRSLRALYGKTKIKNAVHCTDLPTDGLLEVSSELIIKVCLLTNRKLFTFISNKNIYSFFCF